MRLLAMYRYNCARLACSSRTWIALCLAAAIGMGIARDYYRFCVGTALPANVLEVYIVCMSHRLCGIFHPINLCFILSDAPFMDENAAYMIFRAGRRAWYWQGALLVATVCAAYHLFVALSCCLIMIPISYTVDAWSGPAKLLAEGAGRMGLGLDIPPDVMSAYSPLSAALSQFGLYIAYSLPAALMYFALKVNMRRAYAFLIPALLHALMLIVHLDGIYAEYSPFSYLFLQGWVDHGALYRSYFISICALEALLALLIGARGARSMDVNNLAILYLK